MLASAAREEQASSSNAKRRKISEEPPTPIDLDFDLFGSSAFPPDQNDHLLGRGSSPDKPQQVVYDDFEGTDESDVEFEDVDLEPAPEAELETETDTWTDKPEQTSLELDLSKTSIGTSGSSIQRRKPVGPAERKLRLEVHKAHLICLLAHLSCRNRWCETESVQAILKPLVPRRVTALLHVDESEPQYQRSYSFTKGIEEVCSIWRLQWTTTARGMQRAHWKEGVDPLKESDDAEDLVDFDDFKAAARSCSGSRDLGVELFCALLRSVAVDTRLVCSLQVLPFSGVAKGQMSEQPKPQYLRAPPQDYHSSPQNSTITRPERPPPKKRRIVESAFPVVWVEVYSPSTSSWIPLDPIVRNTINKPKTGFEPPAADQLNSLTYVIAFEDDGSAKDVTRRYTQWYNAKTRRQRVESTKGGEAWWRRTMSELQKPFPEARDEIEDATLLRRAESEAMPRNVQDFKGHPVYVLERHLRLSEVIHPKHEVGKVSMGPSKTAKLESVFRRRDVHACRTADAWYRRGRDVNEGEQPLKRVAAKRRRDPNVASLEEVDDDDEADEGTALYAEYQTSLYEPPPVVDGKIPKNAYGNLDVYVPSMIPAGAVHIRHPLAAQAARVLDIAYSDAVTGFEFKGRQGTTVVDGVVVDQTMCNAMINVIEALESQATDEVEAARSKVILSVWKRWLTALRVLERVHKEYGDREEDHDSRTAKADDDDEDDGTYQDEDDENEGSGGGFMLEDTAPGEPATAKDILASQPAFPNLKPLDQLLPAEIVHQDVVVVRSPNKLPGSAETAREAAALVDHDVDKDKGKNDDSDIDGGGGGGGFLLEGEDEDDSEERQHPEPVRTEQHTMAGMTTAMNTAVDVDMDIDETSGGFFPDNGDGDPDGEGKEPVEPAPTPRRTASGEQSTRLTEDTSTPNIAVPLEASQPLLQPQPQAQAHVQSPPHPPPRTLPESSTVGPHANGNANASPSGSGSGSGDASTSHTNAPSLRSETSLLSHDPEEEDAEPEWLLNSLGEMD